MFRGRKGQNTLEYVIILTAIVAALLAGALILGKKDEAGGLGKLMFQSGERIKAESAKVPNIVP